jgi:acetyl esterase/lipase
MRRAAGSAAFGMAVLASVASAAQPRPRDAAAWAAQVANDYAFTPGLVYRTVDGTPLLLDVYAPRSGGPHPAVVYYHGGGWAGGTRDRAVLRLLPYLEMGMAAVNVTYRGAAVALAPAAVEDARCALLWVTANAGAHRIDPARIILTGDSAGSHLALMSGLATAQAGFDGACPAAAAGAAQRAAAIVNWYGATDVADLIEGPNARPFAVTWIGPGDGRIDLARRVSPIFHVRSGAPPILSVHGDADSTVPYAHARRLHSELARLGVRHRLVTIPGGGHGGFTREQDETAYAAVRAFLAAAGVWTGREATTERR